LLSHITELEPLFQRFGVRNIGEVLKERVGSRREEGFKYNGLMMDSLRKEVGLIRRLEREEKYRGC
jgi:hypothetical protein